MAIAPEVKLGKIRVFIPMKREELPMVEPGVREKEVFDECFAEIAKYYGRIAPELKETFDEQYELALDCLRLFKGKIGIEAKKLVGFTPQPGMIGMQPIAPKDIRYVKTPTAGNPAYSQYELNSWDLYVTKGRPNGF